MCRKPMVPLLLLTLLPLVSMQSYAQAKAGTQGRPVVEELTVLLGKTLDNFAFSQSGLLSYKGKPFNPAVRVKPDSVQSFRISLHQSKGLAGAIAEDADGQNSAYLLDLGTQTATPLQKAGTWSGAQQVFWSPSGRYMLVLCAYEGQRFLGVNLQTKKVVEGDFLGPKGKLWAITDAPWWTKGADTLMFTVNETCSPYDDTPCDPERVLAKYTVSLDPATLKASAQKVE
jgi:hypothetical protein